MKTTIKTALGLTALAAIIMACAAASPADQPSIVAKVGEKQITRKELNEKGVRAARGPEAAGTPDPAGRTRKGDRRHAPGGRRRERRKDSRRLSR